MEDFSTNQSPAMQTAMGEVLGDAQNKDNAAAAAPWDSSTGKRKLAEYPRSEQIFWCSDTARRERMMYEHRTSSEGMGRVDGSVRVWMMSGQDSAVRWRFASSNTLMPSATRGNQPSIDFDGDDTPRTKLSAMLVSVEYELDLQHTPLAESARVDLPLHLYGAMAACSPSA